MESRFILVGLALMTSVSCVAADACLRIYPAPEGEPLSTNFTVAVNGGNVPVYTATVATADPVRRQGVSSGNDAAYADQTAFASFDMGIPVEVTVTCPQTVSSAKLLPASSGITPVVCGKQITFTVAKPCQLTLDVNDDWVHSLQLFANPLETDVPRPDDPNVIYFGRGVHQVADVKVTSGKTVYVAGGAVLYGQAQPLPRQGAVFSLSGSNIVLRGRGIIDGSLCPRHTRNLLALRGTNIALEGVVLRDSSMWTVPIRRSERVTVSNLKLFGYRGNSDGIDICNSRKIEVSNCFLRTMDDLVVVKTDKGAGASRDIQVQKCVLWNELAHALSIGAELRAEVANVHFSDCDVIHDKGREWLLRVFHCDAAAVHDVSFDNIRIEESRRLISLWIGKTVWSRDDERGQIANITFRNIRASGPDPRVELKGFDAGHAIRGVRFQNVLINGQRLKPDVVLQNDFVHDVEVTP